MTIPPEPPQQPDPYPLHPAQPGAYQPSAYLPGPAGPVAAGQFWYGYPDPNDPLVTPPYAGINGWFSRIVAAVRRSGRPVAVILFVTQGLPALVVALYAAATVGAGNGFARIQPSSDPGQGAADLRRMLHPLLELIAAAAVYVVVAGFVQAVGWGAATWLTTRRAAGAPATVGQAFAYGLRRAPGLWGWTLVVALIAGAGICFCVVPGIYALFALCLAGPAYLFERRHPLGRSLRLVHANFGPVLGRVLIIGAVSAVYSVAISTGEQLALKLVGDGSRLTPATAVVVVLSSVLTWPVVIAQFLGILVTYAEQRGREAPVTVAQLAGEVG